MIAAIVLPLYFRLGSIFRGTYGQRTLGRSARSSLAISGHGGADCGLEVLSSFDSRVLSGTRAISLYSSECCEKSVSLSMHVANQDSLELVFQWTWHGIARKKGINAQDPYSMFNNAVSLPRHPVV